MDSALLVWTRLTAAAVTLLLIGSCAGLTVKGYPGPILPADRTATVRSGAYTSIEKCDDVKLGSSRLNIVVLPGSHRVEIAFAGRLTDNAFFDSIVNGFVTFEAEAGHAYTAYADLVSTYRWIARIIDEGTGEKVASSESLPLRVQWVYRSDMPH